MDTEDKKQMEQSSEGTRTMSPSSGISLPSLFIDSIFKGVSLKEYSNQMCFEPIVTTSVKKQALDKDKDNKENKPHHHKFVSTSLTQNNTASPSPGKYINKRAVHHISSSSEVKAITFGKSNKDNTKAKDNTKHHLKDLNKTTSPDSIHESHKISAETEKIRKQYETKAKAMQNRLNALKQQEESITRKMNAYRHRESQLEQVRTEKEIFRKAFNSIKADNSKKLQEQKKKNIEIKDSIQSSIKDSMKQIKTKKQQEYIAAKNEKQMFSATISGYLNRLGSDNQKRIEQIKSAHGKHKEEEQKRQKENEQKMKQYYIEKTNQDATKANQLKAQIEEMERIEEHYVNSLRVSMQQKEMMFNMKPKLSVNVSQEDNANDTNTVCDKRVKTACNSNVKPVSTKLTKKGYQHHQFDRSIDNEYSYYGKDGGLNSSNKKGGNKQLKKDLTKSNSKYNDYTKYSNHNNKTRIRYTSKSMQFNDTK